MANPFTIATTATRHMLDANVTFGMSSERFNARDKYRRQYSDDQRLGAGVGTALGVALPVTAGIAWAQRGLKVPGLTNAAESVASAAGRAGGLSPSAMQTVGRVAGVAALGLAAGVGVKKTVEITKDDGHLGAVGTATGVVAGAIGGIKVGQKFAGKYAPLVTGAAAIAGGIAGHMGGKAIKVGESQIGKEHAQAPQVDDGMAHLGTPVAAVGVVAGAAAGAKLGSRMGGKGAAVGAIAGALAGGTVGFVGGRQIDGRGAAGTAIERTSSFSRGGFNHFNEVGPASQGISFGYQWGMRETVQKRYSNAERSGAMHGDLLAAGIMGGGALAVAGGLMGSSRYAAQGMSNIKAGSTIAGHALAQGPVTGAIQKLGDKGALGVGAAALGIAGVTTWKAFQSDSEAWGTGAAVGIAAGTLAATAGAAKLISKSSAVQGLAGAPKAASSALAAAAIIGALSTMRLPLQQFMNDAKDSTAANGGVDWTKAAPVGGLAAAGAGFGALKGLSKLVPEGGLQLGKFRIPKAAVVGVGTAISAAGAGAAGVGLSSTMPDLKTIGMSAAGGAVAGAAAGRFARGIGVIPGAIGGAALGISASSLLRADAPAPAPTTPQEAVGEPVGG